MFDLVIKNALVNGEVEADIGILDGVIHSIASSIDPGSSRVIDAQGGVLTPGGIDTHVHLAQKGAYSAGRVVGTIDSFESGSRSAVAGGTTTVISFAVQSKGEALLPAVDAYADLAKANCYCDYSFHAIITDPTEDVVKEFSVLAAKGITSIKIYLTYESLKLSDRQFLTVLAAARLHGMTVMIHAENADLIEYLTEALLENNLVDPHYHGTAHHPMAENEATYRAICMAQVIGCKVLLVHVSEENAFNHIRNAQTNNLSVFAETCPQYLLLSAPSMASCEGSKFVCSPPLRPVLNQKDVWKAVENGTATCISSDHCPFRYDDDEAGKRLGDGKGFHLIPNGLPGIEVRVPLLYTHGVLRGRISTAKFIELTSTAAAKLYGLYPKKGAILPGSDADLVIWHKNFQPTTIKHSMLHDNCDYTPYEGNEIENWPRYTLVRGQVVWNGEQVLSDLKGHGKFVPREVGASSSFDIKGEVQI